MKQSRLASFFESCGSTLTGFLIGLGCQWLFLPMLGVQINHTQNLIFAGIMTVVSVARGFLWRRLMEALHVRTPLSPAMLAVIAERHRQQAVEGWDIAHDDGHRPGDLARAGAAYLISGSGEPRRGALIWPWNQDWWKPDVIRPRRDLVRGLALGLAELEKLDRTKTNGRRS